MTLGETVVCVLLGLLIGRLLVQFIYALTGRDHDF